MLSRIWPRLNHATIVAYLALFVALGGSSYSAVKISGKKITNNRPRAGVGADLLRRPWSSNWLLPCRKSKARPADRVPNSAYLT